MRWMTLPTVAMLALTTNLKAEEPAFLKLVGDQPSPGAAAVSSECPPACCDDMCVNRPRLYGSVEYFLVWFENQRLPPLVITAPPNFAGGTAGVNVLLGGSEPIDFGGINAIRSTVGYWLDSQQTWSVEASGFLTETASNLFAAFHDGSPLNPVLLARTNGTLLPVAPVGFPGVLMGGISSSQNTQLWGAEGNTVMNWSDRTNVRTDLLAGFRYFDLDESFDIRNFSQIVNGPFGVNQVDSFDARTQFYGGQVGARTTIGWRQLSLSLVGKIGLGGSHLSAGRAGLTVPTLGLVLPSGVLVTPANAGSDSTDRLAVLSETDIQVGYQWTRWLQTTVGYNFMYLTSAARVGDQIQPVGGINTTDFYTNGFTCGVAMRW
jgi:hypothetical protein